MQRKEKYIFVFFAVAMAVAAAVGAVTYIHHNEKRKNPPKYDKERRGIIKRGYFIVMPKRI